MDHKEKDKREASDHELESCKEMKRSLSGSCKGEVVESMADEVIAVKSAPPTMRECDICGKIFGSGKALGGHRRSHFQKQQKKVKVRFTNNQSPKAGDNSNTNNRANCDYDDDGKRVCCICKKEFPTKNALFGHMRSHPERSWRGVSPPTHSHKHSYSYSSYSYSSSSLNSDSMEKSKEDHGDDDDDCVGVFAPDEHHHIDVIDLSKFTSPSWLKKDTRGRKCIGGYEAAETLAYLSAYKYFCGDQSNRVFPKKDEVQPKSASDLIGHEKRKIGESSSSKKQVKKIKFYMKGELELVGNKDGAAECYGDGGGGGGEKVNRCKGLSESGVERVSYMDDEGVDVDMDVDVDEGFDDVNTEVTTTARVQDHFAERKKVKKMDQKGKSSSKKMVLKSKGKDPEYENGSKEKVGGYKCGACGKIFSTFQGLGGHRSIHKEKNIVIKDESNHSDAVATEENNSFSSSNMHKMEEELLNEEPLADEACQSSGTKILNFDLNEPYVMED